MIVYPSSPEAAKNWAMRYANSKGTGPGSTPSMEMRQPRAGQSLLTTTFSGLGSRKTSCTWLNTCTVSTCANRVALLWSGGLSRKGLQPFPTPAPFRPALNRAQTQSYFQQHRRDCLVDTTTLDTVKANSMAVVAVAAITQ